MGKESLRPGLTRGPACCRAFPLPAVPGALCGPPALPPDRNPCSQEALGVSSSAPQPVRRAAHAQSRLLVTGREPAEPVERRPAPWRPPPRAPATRRPSTSRC